MGLIPKSKSERALLVFGILLLLAGLSYALADWHGSSAWEKYKREWEAKGEKFDFKDFVPKTVPDDQNFALAPIVASGYERNMDKNGHWISPPNTNIVDRLSMEVFGNEYNPDTPTNGSWKIGRKTELKDFQFYYRMLARKTNEFAITPEPQSPAADVLLALNKYNSDIAELRDAAQLPVSRFPLNYDSDPLSLVTLPHLAALKHCCQVLQLRAVAELENNQSEKALEDIKLMLRLANSIRTEPFLISHLVRVALVDITFQPVWEGLTEHKWSDTQLVELNGQLAKLDFLTDYEFSMRGERAYSIAMIDYLRRTRNFDSFEGDRSPEVIEIATKLVPSSVFYQNELIVAQMNQQWILPAVNAEQRLVVPKSIESLSTAIDEMRKHWSMDSLLAAMILPGLEPVTGKYVYAQSSVDMARVACALERYRLANGEYPETLNALAPQFIETIPHDIIGGQPLHYHRTDNGKFLLYSIGWNETDDGGTVVLGKYSKISPDISQGDWVWEN